MDQQILKTLKVGNLLKVRNGYGGGLDGAVGTYTGWIEPSSAELGVIFSRVFQGTTHNLGGKISDPTGRWIPYAYLDLYQSDWD